MTPDQPNNRTTCVRVTSVTAAIATGKHPDPSRTRKLSLPAPMVLPPRGGGRVGRRRTSFPAEATPAVASAALRRPDWRATATAPLPTAQRPTTPEKVTTRGRPATHPASRTRNRRSGAVGRRPRQDRQASQPGRQAAWPGRQAPRPAATRPRGRGERLPAASVAPGPARVPRARATGRGPSEEQRPRSASQAVYDGPPIPEDITGRRAGPLHQRPAQGSARRSSRPASPATWRPPAC